MNNETFEVSLKLNKNRGGIETATIELAGPNVKDTSPIFGKLRWMPVPAYFFGNGIVITPDGEIILSRSEDREQFTPYGGEIDWKNGEQSNEAAAREIIEETEGWVSPKPNELILFDSVKVFPFGNSDGIIRSIDTFVYFMKETDRIPDIHHQVHEEGCRIVDVICTTPEELDDLIKKGEIKVYPNFVVTLKKLEVFLKDWRKLYPPFQGWQPRDP